MNADGDRIKIFNQLIRAMGDQVIWGGHFYIIDNLLVLDGVIRSLCFSFDSKKAEVKLIDLPDIENETIGLSGHPELGDLLSMAIYAFAVWRQLPGVYSSQDTGQINGMLASTLAPYHLKPDFGGERFLLYKDGKQLTYEKAIQEILEYGEKYEDTALPQQVLFLGLSDFIRFGEADSEGLVEADFTDTEDSTDDSKVAERDSRLVEEHIEKFHARIHVLDRLSGRQIFQLTRDIKNDKLLTAEEKEELYFPIEDYEFQKRMYQIEKGFAEGRKRTYANIQKLIDNLEKEDLYPNVKKRVMDKLEEMRIRYGEQEVRQIMSSVPDYVEYTQYQELMARLAPYQDLNLSVYTERLNKMREKLEIKEISNMLVQSPKKTRKDYIELLKKIEKKGFSSENTAPYIENILDNVREFDRKKLSALVQHVQQMDFDTAAGIYEQVEQESFLPDLRESAIAVLSKRLAQIRMAECVHLVHKLREIMISANFHPNERHYVYPIEQIIKKTVDRGVQKLFHTALANFAQGRGMFEYPLFLVDTSKNADGGEGMLLTPENLFYSTRLSEYKVPIHDIKLIQESGGILNHKLLLEETNGVRHKIPIAVTAEELSNWEKVLGQFIVYLQGRKVSNKLKYKGKGNACICSRCGCVYSGQGCCPECGYRRLEE